VSGPDKVAMRHAARAARRGLTPQERTEASAAIAASVLGVPALVDATAVHLYLPTPFEVNTVPIAAALLLEGKRVIVPSVDDMSAYELALEDLDALVEGPLGVPLPPELRLVPLGWWDVVLVPVVAFDANCRRLGQGGGYYDRLLASAPRPAIGLAFEVQRVDAVPVEDHDRRLDLVVTERTVYTADPRDVVANLG
jgi:5-formyltetrahydrofolate cyclo-ligase